MRARGDAIAVEGPAPAGGAERGAVRWGYSELEARAATVAEGLRARGAGPGARLAAVLPPGPEIVLLLHATRRLGATLVPLNAGWPAAELERALQVVAPVTGILREGEVWGMGGSAGGAAVSTGGAGAGRRHAVGPPVATVAGDAAPYGDAGTRRDPDTPPAAILLTSGSTGAPRPVALSWGNLEASARGSIERLDLRAEDRWLAVLSPAHVGGLALLHRAAAVGCGVVTRPRFDADEVAELLDAGAFSHASLVPVMLARLVEAHLRLRGETPLPPSLRALLVGGAETPRPLLERALDLGYPIALTYGLTEATSQVATATPEEVRRRPGSSGRPLPGVEVRVAPEPEGEILVRGPTVAVGAPRLAGPVGVDADGWLHTGDLGRLEPDGSLVVTGRLSDRIVSGGVTVDPAEVEAVLLRHAEVAEAAVLGLPDPEWGERVVAAVVARGPSGGRSAARDGALPASDAGGASSRAGAPPDFAAELLAFARERLGAGKRPREVRLLAALPRNANGKVDRAALVRAFLTDRGGVTSGP